MSESISRQWHVNYMRRAFYYNLFCSIFFFSSISVQKQKNTIFILKLRLAASNVSLRHAAASLALVGKEILSFWFKKNLNKHICVCKQLAFYSYELPTAHCPHSLYAEIPTNRFCVFSIYLLGFALLSHIVAATHSATAGNLFYDAHACLVQYTVLLLLSSQQRYNPFSPNRYPNSNHFTQY